MPKWPRPVSKATLRVSLETQQWPNGCPPESEPRDSVLAALTAELDGARYCSIAWRRAPEPTPRRREHRR
jgi:hypothetical protein